MNEPEEFEIVSIHPLPEDPVERAKVIESAKALKAKCEAIWNAPRSEGEKAELEKRWDEDYTASRSKR